MECVVFSCRSSTIRDEGFGDDHAPSSSSEVFGFFFFLSLIVGMDVDFNLLLALVIGRKHIFCWIFR